jgi:hypothetical protein
MSIRKPYPEDSLVPLREAARFFECSIGLLTRGLRQHQLASVQGPSRFRTGPRVIQFVRIADVRAYLTAHTTLGSHIPPVGGRLLRPATYPVTWASAPAAEPQGTQIQDFLAWLQVGLREGYVPEALATEILKANATPKA